MTIKHFHAHQSGLPLAKDGTMDVLIIENIFYGQDVPRIYDLKGSERSRWSEEDPSVAGSVLMDANLRESNLTAPLLVRVCQRRLEMAGFAQGLSVNWQQQVEKGQLLDIIG